MLLSPGGRQHRLLFFGGKGGVGKTTLASAAAIARSRGGQSVLVVSTDPAHNLGHLWETTVGSGEVQLSDGVWGTELDPGVVAADHVRTVARTVRGLMPEHLHRQVDRYFDLTLEAPGTHESALLDAMTRTIDDGLRRFDVVIFDTAPTGHTTRLLEMPRVMQMWTDGLLASRDRADRFTDAMRGLDGGRRAPNATDVRNSRIRDLLEDRKARFVDVQARLTDPDLTGFVVVTLPERMPVLESIELYRRLQDAGVGVPAVVVNRCLTTGPGHPEEPDRAWRAEDQQRQIATLGQAVDAPLLRLQQTTGPMTGFAAIAGIADQMMRW